jgi:hypothetical protein
MYMYIYVQWCDSYIDAVPSATICFWTNQRFALFLSFFFLHMYIYIEYVQKETRLILLQSMTGQNWYYHVIFAFMHKFFFLSPPLFFLQNFLYDDNDRRHLGHSFVLSRRLADHQLGNISLSPMW